MWKGDNRGVGPGPCQTDEEKEKRGRLSSGWQSWVAVYKAHTGSERRGSKWESKAVGLGFGPQARSNRGLKGEEKGGRVRRLGWSSGWTRLGCDTLTRTSPIRTGLIFLSFFLGWILLSSFTFIFHLKIIQIIHYLSLKIHFKDLKVSKTKDKNSYKIWIIIY